MITIVDDDDDNNESYQMKHSKTEEALKLLLFVFDLLESGRISVSSIFSREQILFLF